MTPLERILILIGLFLLALSVKTQPCLECDPYSVFVSDRLVTYNDDPSSGYAREDFQWYIKNTGQDSRLFQNGVYQSTEAGGSYDIKASAAWSIQPYADGVTVGIVDAGCQSNHEDMAGVILRGHYFNDRQGIESDDYTDWNGGHGTLIAGIIAAHRNNSLGIAGIADGSKLLIVSTLYAVSEMTKGINWCVDNGANIICLSWGGTSTADTGLSNACVRAGTSNVIIVNAEFNNGADLDTNPIYPYSWHFENVVSVCGLTREGLPWSPSAHGSNCLGAPARIIVSTAPTNQYQYSSGNSFASPMVSGTLALVRARFPNQSAAALISTLFVNGPKLDALSALTSPVPVLYFNSLKLHVGGLPKFVYDVERSTDLVSWVWQATVHGNDEIDVSEGFYRAKVT